MAQGFRAAIKRFSSPADSILLYAGNHPVFVVDAYTRRILERHELIPAKAAYDEIRQLFERALEPLAEEMRGPVLVAEKVELSTPAPKGAVENERFTASLKRRPDTRSTDTNQALSVSVRAAPRGSSHPPSPMSTAARTPAAQVFSEMHALLVGVGKNYCKTSQSQCEHCPLQRFLPRPQ